MVCATAEEYIDGFEGHDVITTNKNSTLTDKRIRIKLPEQIYQPKKWIDPVSFDSNIIVKTFPRLRQSPFDRLDQLKPNTQQVLELINEIDPLSIENKERIIARLKFLNEVRLEEEPEDTPMLAASLRNFISFLYSLTSLKYPDIVLTAKGLIRCEWHISSSRRCIVEFLSDAHVSFLIVDSPQGKNTRLSGYESSNKLISFLRALNYYDWLID